ncbi:hypothetical protein [Marinobacter nauticus]|uniref:hypothetical protein n=1 Tax=Marinobacter nauticus TaxID=2743 RepID=UPI001C573934|nr:hypothetical protein [Marinobacter nauticus]MBW3199150.1 hypothetical protein [Marinobacter nauticus]MBY6184560.1 hypothetical protein [Marinobacter nauticus]
MKSKNKTDSTFKVYWSAYGGPEAILRSKFFAIAILLTAISYPLWLLNDYSDFPTSILPDILGFSIGAFAVWLGFGSEDFKEVITRIETKHGNGYDVSNASFLHLIIVQTTTLIYSIAFKAIIENETIQKISITVASKSEATLYLILTFDFIFRFIGFLLFSYSLTLIIAVGMNIFRITTWHRKYLLHRAIKRKQNQKQNGIHQRASPSNDD